MKQPYFQERTILPRVEKYMEENKYIDVEEMTVYLMNNYREFHGKKKKAFMKSVEKAYRWHLHCHQKTEELDDCEDVMDSDGGGSDIMEIIEPEPLVETVGLNTMLTKMYKSPSVSSSSTPIAKRNGDFYMLDTEGDHSVNGIKSPEKSVRKKRKKEKEGAIEEIIKKKKKQLLPEESTITYAHMAGIESLKDKICDLIANLRWPGILQPLQKSVLLTGPSGSGKTTFAQALAGTTESPVLRVTATELVGGVSGESEEKINEIFEQAASLTRCVLLIEKIDVVVPKEGSTKSLEKRIGAQLTSCLNALKSKHRDKQLLVMGETSHPESLDWDLRSSFDGEIFMAIPTEAARAQILQLLCEGTSFVGDFEELAHRTPGYVAGDLKKLLEKAQGLAWKRKKESLAGKTEEGNLMEQLKSFMNHFEKMCESGEANTVVTISMEDFMEALMLITPALKREGFPTVPDVTWEDIGGLEDVKEELREKILDPIKYVKLHEEFGASRPNGILMWGPPGCGKTLLAKAVANEAGINLLPVMGPELLNMYQGESERAVREVFRRARNVAPCVIFFDEFDSLCPVRSKGAESGSKTTIVNTLLTEMNGFTKREDVYIVAATNRPDILDPAVTRPGRFDTLLYVDVPDHLGRISIFQARTKNGKCPHLAPDVSFEEVSHLCNNFSGADCDQLVYLASKEAIREVINNNAAFTSTACAPTSEGPVKRLVARKHFSAALKKIKPSITVEEQKRYKKLHSKMEASKVQGELPGFPKDIGSLAEDSERQSQPLDVKDYDLDQNK